MVATKAALSIRVDALTDADGKSEEAASSIGLENRTKLESRLRALEHQIEGGTVRRFTENGKKQQRFEMTGETKTYNAKADQVELVSTQREHPVEVAMKAVLDVKEEKRRAKEERKAKKRAEKEKEKDHEEDEDEERMDVDGETKKEKKRKRRESEVNGAGSMDVDEVEQPKVAFDTFFSFVIMLMFVPFRRRLRKRERRGKRPRKRPRLLPLLMGLIHRRRKRKSPRHDLIH